MTGFAFDGHCYASAVDASQAFLTAQKPIVGDNFVYATYGISEPVVTPSFAMFDWWFQKITLVPWASEPWYETVYLPQCLVVDVVSGGSGASAGGAVDLLPVVSQLGNVNTTLQSMTSGVWSLAVNTAAIEQSIQSTVENPGNGLNAEEAGQYFGYVFVSVVSVYVLARMVGAVINFLRYER